MATDAELRRLLPPRSGVAPSNLEAVRQGLVGVMRDVWTEPAVLDAMRLAIAADRAAQAIDAARWNMAVELNVVPKYVRNPDGPEESWTVEEYLDGVIAGKIEP